MTTKSEQRIIGETMADARKLIDRDRYLARCGSCRWWDIDEAAQLVCSTAMKPEATYAKCRARPPRATSIGPEWPVTDIDDWCGEYVDCQEID